MATRKPIFYRQGAIYRGFVTERNSTAILTTFDSSAVTFNWERKRNVATEASVTINPECTGAQAERFQSDLAACEPWAHELHIERLGVEVWVGPVYRPSELIGETAEILARDMLAWLQVRAVHSLIDRTAAGQGPCDPVTFAGLLIRDALAPDDPGLLDLLTLYPSDSSARPQDRKVDPAQGDMCWENGLSPMLGSSIDITTVGRRIVVFQNGRCTGSADGFVGNNDIVSGFKVGRDGGAWASRVIVRGSKNSDTVSGAPLVGSWGGEDARYGLVERRVSDDVVGTAEGAAYAARTKLAAYGASPMVALGADNTTSASAGELDCDTDLDIGTLSVGACIPADLSAGAFEAAGLFFVDGIEVTLGGSGEVPSILLLRPSEIDRVDGITTRSRATLGPVIYYAEDELPPASSAGPGMSLIWCAGDSLTAGYPPGTIGWPDLIPTRSIFDVSRGGASFVWPGSTPQLYRGWNDLTLGGRIGDYVRTNVEKWGAPATIVIMGGTNDWASGADVFAVTQELLALNAYLTAHGTSVRWVTAAPLTGHQSQRQAFNTFLLTTFPNVINIESLADSAGAWRSGLDLGDGVHPNLAGKTALANLILAAL